MKYDLTFLTTEGWKRHKVDTEKTPDEIAGYLSSRYVKKVHAEPAKYQDAYGYLPLEETITSHPRYSIPSDKALNYFKYTKHDYVDAEVMMLKDELRHQDYRKEQSVKESKHLVEYFLK